MKYSSAARVCFCVGVGFGREVSTGPDELERIILPQILEMKISDPQFSPNDFEKIKSGKQQYTFH